jgi:group I intron endonuclease
MTIGVYAIVHKASRRFYIGSSINVEKRLIQHRSKLNRTKHHCHHLQSAWNKYGEDAFEFILKCVATSERECRDIEQAVLDTLFDFSYNSKNMAFGGGTGDANVMRKPEIAKKVSVARLGMKFSDEHRRNLSDALKGRPGVRLGSVASDASKEKMRKAKLGKKTGPYRTLTCPHCGKVGAGGSMRRWHFDKCRSKE